MTSTRTPSGLAASSDRLVRLARQLVERTTTPAVKWQLLRLHTRLLDLRIRSRVARGALGPLPDFIIIGSQKCGTTYLFNLLATHPAVRPPITKELHYFDFSAHKGMAWYRACFPQRDRQDLFVTGEASPYYIFHPRVPRLIDEALPEVKLVALLRNPVDRAYSHYHHNARLGFEPLSFEEALDQEPARMAGERERMLEDESYVSYNHSHFGYQTRGQYVEHLPEWCRRFPEERLLILQSEAFYGDTPATLEQVSDFLSLPPWQPDTRRPHRAARYPRMAPATRARLADHFAPYNQRLYDEFELAWRWEGEQ